MSVHCYCMIVPSSFREKYNIRRQRKENSCNANLHKTHFVESKKIMFSKFVECVWSNRITTDKSHNWHGYMKNMGKIHGIKIDISTHYAYQLDWSASQKNIRSIWMKNKKKRNCFNTSNTYNDNHLSDVYIEIDFI